MGTGMLWRQRPVKSVELYAKQNSSLSYKLGRAGRHLADRQGGWMVLYIVYREREEVFDTEWQFGAAGAGFGQGSSITVYI